MGGKKVQQQNNKNTNSLLPAQPLLGEYQVHQPASYLKKEFFIKNLGESRLYITAKGLYVAWINGKKIGDMVLAPGTFSSDNHLGIQTYNVSSLLKEGKNQILIALGDGWFRSTSGVDGDRNIFGEDLGLWFRIEINQKIIWETWDGIDENGKPKESLNHYAYGAISGWLFKEVSGIEYKSK